ncbi:MAG TPA: hypothetical protein K8V08_08305 [Brevibacterium senegalense]|uniref:Uncharacterized protein n=1 Tax=Brevibacterium senegalense TaxID=1033736 RepID=A0A921SP61_9MICO|nr:hypothetical protein [Brevibacterium senegalense]
MSGSRLSAAGRIWRSGRGTSPATRASALYAAVLVCGIVIVPLVRALVLAADSAEGIVLLSSAHAPGAVALVTAALWAGALLVGRNRGPALLPPFLLHALTSSDLRRSEVLRSPVLRSLAVLGAVCSGAAAVAGTTLLSHGLASLGGVAVFVMAGGTAGEVTALLWLTGQVFPRAAVPSALTVLALAVLGFAGCVPAALLPWDWVGATYPVAEPGLAPLVGILLLTTAFAALVPVLLDRLSAAQLIEQAERWRLVTAFSSSLDARSAQSVYDTGPRWGRRIRAIRSGKRRWSTFIIRDAVGLLRTPGRSAGALVAVAATGVLTVLAVTAGTADILLWAVAGLMIHTASGPLSTGLQHAADAAGDLPLYGIGDALLVLFHALCPLAILIIVPTAAAACTAHLGGVPVGSAVVSSGALGVLALALRLCSALKGPLPPGLLAPVSTPAGDLSAVGPVLWALDEAGLAICGALALAVLPAAPLPFMLIVAGTAALLSVRWRRRR